MLCEKLHQGNQVQASVFETLQNVFKDSEKGEEAPNKGGADVSHLLHQPP